MTTCLTFRACFQILRRPSGGPRAGGQAGPISGPFRTHFELISSPIRAHFGLISGSFWVHFGSNSGSIPGPFWAQFGSISGPFRAHFGPKSSPFRPPHPPTCLPAEIMVRGGVPGVEDPGLGVCAIVICTNDPGSAYFELSLHNSARCTSSPAPGPLACHRGGRVDQPAEGPQSCVYADHVWRAGPL